MDGAKKQKFRYVQLTLELRTTTYGQRVSKLELSKVEVVGNCTD